MFYFEFPIKIVHLIYMHQLLIPFAKTHLYFKKYIIIYIIVFYPYPIFVMNIYIK